MSDKPWYRIENAAAQVAEVYILDEISPFGITAQDFIGDLSKVSAGDINLHLNTPGGDVFDGIAIFNALKSHPATVHAFIPGIAASIGTVIAMAADTITIAPHARMMIHEAWGMSMGNASDMAKMAERLEATSENIASIYAERAGETTEYWRNLMRAETWYTDQQAVDVGLADDVGRAGDKNALKQAALFDLHRYRHGEREAARLMAEVPDEVAHGVTCLCGNAECAEIANSIQREPEAVPVPETNKFVREREELEALIASVHI